MKIIHCADFHIDSKSFEKFSAEKRNIKRAQLLQNFVDMVDFAEQNKVGAILLCGDIFDDKKPLKRSLKVVQDVILAHKDIIFFYIWGNHDEFVKIFDKNPDNFVCFGDNFGKIDLGDVTVGGVSFKRSFDENFYDQISFDKNDFNILMLHGQIDSDKYFMGVDLKKLDTKDIDYIAFGHVHKRADGKIGKRGIWQYAGCVESQSFANVGKCGFDVLDIKDKKLKKEFVPFSKYDYQIVRIDITNLNNFNEILNKIDENTSNFRKSDIVRIVFCGRISEDFELNVNVVLEKFKDKFFYVEVSNETKLVFDLKKYANESLSLKAEFINIVNADKTLTEDEKQQICLAGLEALKGEEVSI